MKTALAIVAILAALVSFAAHAQMPALPYAWPRTVGTSAAGILPINNQRKRVLFHNPNAAALVSVCPQVSRLDSTLITCSLRGPGALLLLPGAYITLDGVGGNPQLPGAWFAVSDTGGSSLTILEWE